MKIYLFIIVATLTCIFSINNDFMLKSETHQLVRREAAFTNYQYGKHHILALILKEHHSDITDCKAFLKGYCEKLQKSGLNTGQLNSLLDNICNHQDEECKDFEEKIKKKGKEIEKRLQNAIKNYDQSAYYDLLHDCFFFESSFPNLKEKCKQLRHTIHDPEIFEIIQDILFRVLKKDVNSNECKNKLENVCLYLSRENILLMEKCLNPQDTCKELSKKTGAVCENMKNGIDKFLKTNVDSSSCFVLLDKCYFYKDLCSIDKYGNLEEKCEEKGSIYTPPDIINPIEEDAPFSEKINMPKVLSLGENKNIYMYKFGSTSIEKIIAYLIKNANDKVKKCQELLKEDTFNYYLTLSSGGGGNV